MSAEFSRAAQLARRCVDEADRDSTELVVNDAVEKLLLFLGFGLITKRLLVGVRICDFKLG
jgi:hypothetical protein